jgi:hypothetical protein
MLPHFTAARAMSELSPKRPRTPKTMWFRSGRVMARRSNTRPAIRPQRCRDYRVRLPPRAHPHATTGALRRARASVHRTPRHYGIVGRMPEHFEPRERPAVRVAGSPENHVDRIADVGVLPDRLVVCRAPMKKASGF